MLKYQVSWNSVQSETSCSMHTDGRTDVRTYMTKLKVTFRNFEKRLQISINYYPSYYMGQGDAKNDKYHAIITSHPSDGRIIMWRCCRCFSKGRYDVVIISAWSVIVYVLLQVSHIVWQPSRLGSLRINSPGCACAGKTRWLTRQGQIVGSTRLMTQRACRWIKTSEWHIPAQWRSKNRLVYHLGPDSLLVTLVLLTPINGMKVLFK